MFTHSLALVLLFSVVLAYRKSAFGIDTKDQDEKNLVAMLKRNGFTEEKELQEALKVLRPEKFKGNNKGGGARRRRQTAASPVVPNSEPSVVIVAPPLYNNKNAHALWNESGNPAAPQLPDSKHQLAISPDGVQGALGKVVNLQSSSGDSQPTSSSIFSTNEEESKDSEGRGILSRVVRKVASLFSASE